ncbi:actin-like ATPase domain-containing protein [Venturia nashicola]|uniref:Actin-like ATPase domain-containing protein n=1 Tax=Venturia nashicola TaxID=86259 RepID=A0A4Z1PQX1_9PEZI|nr:actin-like ATPase domain-containing protein [Venturia nashicola]
MPPFKDEQILIIAPGSQTTLGQYGIPESLTPATHRVRSRMFPGEIADKWEPFKIRHKEASNGAVKAEIEGVVEPEYFEDQVTEDGAVWPMEAGRIVNWSCFFGLLEYVHSRLSPSLHSPIFLVGQPCWTVKDHQKITQFIFEKFHPPAFNIVDSALCAMFAYKEVTNACIVDIGYHKADITAITDFSVHTSSRQIAVPDCGGQAFTERLYELLKTKKFSREMCEQLKKSPVCEILPPGIPMPGSGKPYPEDITNPASAASTGASGSGPGQRHTAGALGDTPLGPGKDTEVGDEEDEDDNEGVLDIANIVTSGNMQQFLADKEKSKAEKAGKNKKNGEPTAAQQKQNKLRNAEREKATFIYSDHALLDALKRKNLTAEEMAHAAAAVDEGAKQSSAEKQAAADAIGDTIGAAAAHGPQTATSLRQGNAPRREIEVGIERFQSATGGAIDRIADAIHRTVSQVEEVSKRSELWDNLIVVGNGAKIRGFREALLASIQSRYIISPSSATIFTSELPSNISTPVGAGSQTPNPAMPHQPQPGSSVNPLLLAATTQHLQHPGSHLHPGSQTPGSVPGQMAMGANVHSSHGQTPTSAKFAKVGEYFPEWKDVGFDEGFFLGAQVACRVIFVVDAGMSKCFMTRTDYNELGPAGISDFAL